MILKNGKRIDGCTDTLPVGTVQPFLGLTPPLGYLICQGQLISKVEYPELYNICKSTFGTETATHFYLPDLRGKTIAGYHSGDDTFNILGLSLGEKTHLLTELESGIREHTHAMPLAQSAGVQDMTDVAYRATAGGALDPEFRTGRVTGIHKTNPNDYAAPYLSGQRDANAVNAHNNIQPTMVLNWIVKAVMLIPQYFTVENTLTSTSSTNAISAAQGKILNDKINMMLPFPESRTAWTWGVAKADNGYVPLVEWMEESGASMAFATKDTQLSVQIDGLYYQNEGKSRVLDVRDLATSYAFYKWPSKISISTSGTTTVTKELTITTKKGNPVFLIVTGDNNPMSEGVKNWFNINFYRNGTLLCHQIVESHELSHNIPFAMQYLDVVATGTYTYKVEFKIGNGSADLGENGAHQTPNFTVFEI